MYGIPKNFSLSVCNSFVGLMKTTNGGINDYISGAGGGLKFLPGHVGILLGLYCHNSFDDSYK